MHTLVLIRHAIAEERETWRGEDDAQRPLNAEGRRQAKHIAKMLPALLEEEVGHGLKIVSLGSSPALRCVQTVEPLTERIGMKIVIDQTLMEGSEIAPPSPRDDGAHVLCAHGDNIPWLLDKLKINWNGRCKKGSMWLIQRDGRGKVIKARYEKVD